MVLGSLRSLTEFLETEPGGQVRRTAIHAKYALLQKRGGLVVGSFNLLGAAWFATFSTIEHADLLAGVSALAACGSAFIAAKSHALYKNRLEALEMQLLGRDNPEVPARKPKP